MMSAGMRMAPCADRPGDWPAGVITSYLHVNHALRGERNKAYINQILATHLYVCAVEIGAYV